MAKVLVKFRTGYSRYNQGETAAFEAAKAEQLCAGKNPVAQVVGPVKGASAQSSDSIDLLGLERQELALAGENLGEQLAEIERREENLVNALAFHNECERDLEARELAISEREKAIETAAKSGAEKEPAVKVESQPAAPVEEVAEAKDKAPGAPPKQGAKS